MPDDAAVFQPSSPKDLLRSMRDVVIGVALKQGKAVWSELSFQLDFIAKKTMKVAAQLAANAITVDEADFTLHLLEMNLNSALRELKFLQYAVAQKILSAVFDLLKSAIRSLTGVNLF